MKVYSIGIFVYNGLYENSYMASFDVDVSDIPESAKKLTEDTLRTCSELFVSRMSILDTNKYLVFEYDKYFVYSLLRNSICVIMICSSGYPKDMAEGLLDTHLRSFLLD